MAKNVSGPRTQRTDHFEERKKKLFIYSNALPDPIMVLIILTLAFAGLIMLFSASYPVSFTQGRDNTGLTVIFGQLGYTAVGLFAMFAISNINLKLLENRALQYLLYIGVFVLLIVVLVKHGPDEDGVKRWIFIGGFSFQPSEFAKFAILIFYASAVTSFGHVIKRKKYVYHSTPPKSPWVQKLRMIHWDNVKRIKSTRFIKWICANPDRKEFFTFLFLLAVGCFVAVLVFLEHHLSGTLIILGLSVLMLYVMGFKKKYILILMFLAFAAIAVVVYIIAKSDGNNTGNKIIDNVLNKYMYERIYYWIHKTKGLTLQRRQTYQSLIAIGSGGFSGRGFGNSTQKYLYLSQPQTDFIFSIICEELGFIGACGVIALYAFLFWRVTYIAHETKDNFEKVLVTGIGMLICLEAILNIMVVTDLIPNTGISLPLFSNGGSALLTFYAELGIVLAVSRRNRMTKKV